MIWLHTYLGIISGWLLFVIFVTGTLSYFTADITYLSFFLGFVLCGAVFSALAYWLRVRLSASSLSGATCNQDNLETKKE